MPIVDIPDTQDPFNATSFQRPQSHQVTTSTQNNELVPFSRDCNSTDGSVACQRAIPPSNIPSLASSSSTTLQNVPQGNMNITGGGNNNFQTLVLPSNVVAYLDQKIDRLNQEFRSFKADYQSEMKEVKSALGFAVSQAKSQGVDLLQVGSFLP